MSWWEYINKVAKKPKWLLQDLTYFTNDQMYPPASPEIKTIQSCIEFMRTSISMGIIAFLFTTYSVRSKLYGDLRQYKGRIMKISALSIGTVVSVLNYVQINCKQQNIQQTQNKSSVNYFQRAIQSYSPIQKNV